MTKLDSEEKTSNQNQATVPADIDAALNRLAKLNLVGNTVTGCVAAQKKDRSCCNGKGFVYQRSGSAYVSASLCDCIRQCRECYGLTRRIKDGVSQPCVVPSPLAVSNIINAADLPARYIDASFSSDAALQQGNAKQVFRQMNNWAQEFRLQNAKSVVISGSIGIGKTYVLIAVAKLLAERGFTVKYTEFCQLLAELKAGFSDGSSEAAILEPLLAVDLLIIDEIGMGRNSDWERTIIDNLISGRYNRNRPILGATNFQLVERGASHTYNIDLERDLQGRSEFNPDHYGSLEPRIGARVYSRLQETALFIEMSGANLRQASSSSSSQQAKSTKPQKK